jgi:hypothetical protein
VRATSKGARDLIAKRPVGASLGPTRPDDKASVIHLNRYHRGRGRSQADRSFEVGRREGRMISQLACGTGMHRIDRGTRIDHNNRNGPYVYAAGVTPVTTVRPHGWVLPDRQGAKDQGRRTRRSSR